MSDRSYRGLLWGLVVLGLTLDLGSKYGVFYWLYNGGRGDVYVVVPDVFELMAQFTGATEPGHHPLSGLRTLGGPVLPRVNHGALFGLANRHETFANATFAAISIAAAIAIAYWSTLRSTVRDRALCASLGLILAGTLGNLYDRVVFNGVRDFIHWHYQESVEWPVFNIADCCLVCGALLLLAQAFFARSVPADEQSSGVAALNAEVVQAK